MMTQPTEPGWYWYENVEMSSPVRWQPVHVVDDENSYIPGLSVYLYGREIPGSELREYDISKLKGRWGKKAEPPPEELPLPRRFRCVNDDGTAGAGVMFPNESLTVYWATEEQPAEYIDERQLCNEWHSEITEWIDPPQ